MADGLGCQPMETSDEGEGAQESEDASLRNIILRRVRRRNAVAHHPALLRLVKDLQELRPQRGVEVEFREQDPWGLLAHVRPAEGFYSAALGGDGLRYTFRVAVGPEYPFEPPSVACRSPWPPLHHPNVEPCSGRVGMELLQCDWTPIMSLGGVLDALQGLLEEPLCSGPSVLNAEAARQLRHAPQELVAAVREQQCARLQLASPEPPLQQQQQQQRAESGEEDEDECCWSRLKRRELEDCCPDHEDDLRSPKRFLVSHRPV